MRTSNLKTALIGVTSAAALSLALGISPAAATPPPFTLNAGQPGLTNGSIFSNPSDFTATDINGLSSSLIQQTGPTTQMETGWVQGTSFSNGIAVSGNLSGLVQEGQPGSCTTATCGFYGLYLLYTAKVHGLTSFGPGIGTVGPGDYSYKVFADVGDNDTFAAASTSAGGGSAPTVTNVGSPDVVLAVGASVAGQAGFQVPSGAPTFDVIADFIICDGVSGQGVLGGIVTAAPGCGTYDARGYFVSPNPFYQFDINSATAGSLSDLNTDPTGTPPNATVNNVVADINFFGIPEPATLAMFGTALILLGSFGWQQRRKS